VYSGSASSRVHDRAAVAQIVNGFEQWHDVYVELAVKRLEQPDLLEQ